MAKKFTHVFDAAALIALLKAEEGSDKVTEILSSEANAGAVHIVNLCEVYYGYLRTNGVAEAEAAWSAISEVMAVVDLASEDFVKRVARWKADRRLGIADAFAAATAEEHACPLVTCDRNDFGAIAEDGLLEIFWIR